MDIFKTIRRCNNASEIEHIKNSGDINAREFYNMIPFYS